MRVLIVDDDNLVVLSLKTILEAGGLIQVIATGSDGTEAVRLYQELRPDALLMDIRMKEMTGIEAAEEILKTDPEAKILFLTTFSDEEYIARAINLGAKGYILKQDFESIVPALQAVCLGQSVFGAPVMNKIPALLQAAEEPDYSGYQIGEKEREIIREVAAGLSNKEIAAKLFLSEGTVRNYVSVILEKLSLRDRTQLAVFYYRNRENGNDI